MDRIYESGASATPPTLPATPSIGYPSRGNPTAGVMATVPGPYMFYQLVEEVMGVIAAGGVTPNAADLTQLKQALDALYLHPSQGLQLPRDAAKSDRGIIVPFYQYPGNVYTNMEVLRLALTIQSNPSVEFLIVINPQNGTGGVMDGNYSALIEILHGAGARVLGYVASTYGAKALAAVYADIDSWTALYPAVDGIFVDEMNNTNAAVDIPYYTAITDYGHRAGYAPMVANPGTTVPASYFAAADIILYVEANGYQTEAWLSQFYAGGAGIGVMPAQKAALVYNVAFDEVQTALMQKYAKWLYVTDAPPANPYLVMSSYFAQLVHFVSGLGGNMAWPLAAAPALAAGHALTLGQGDGRYLPRIGDPVQDIALHSATFVSSPVMGGAHNLPIGYDLNTLNDSGFFDGYQLLNAPNGAASWFYIVSTAHSSSVMGSNQWAQQLAFDFSTQAVWVRTCQAGVWAAWARMADAAYVDAQIQGVRMTDTAYVDAQIQWVRMADTAYVDAQIQNAVPVGTILDFAGPPASVPAGMLVLPVSPTNVSRTSYAALFAAIGTAWGAGDGATTFGLPWLPSAHATLQGDQNTGTLGSHTLGQVMAHSHTTTLALGTIGGAANQCVTSALFQQNYNFPSAVVGGPANLAAGVFVTKMIKYI